MRIERIDRADMTKEQAEVFDTAKATTGITGGPFTAFIRVPKIFQAAQDMIAAISPKPISMRERTLINLATARHYGARYPWHAQCRHAVSSGLGQDVIDAINDRGTPELADPRERICYTVAAEIAATKGLSDATYKEAEAVMGIDDLVALIASVGSFTTTCLTANVFELNPPPDDPIPLKP